jgi:hypothetical protein
MSTETRCADGDCPTVGVDASALERFAAVETEDAEMLVYDTDGEDAWIQSGLHYPRDACV